MSLKFGISCRKFIAWSTILITARDCAERSEVRESRTENWSRPEVSIHGAGQMDRSLWGRECIKEGVLCKSACAIVKYAPPQDAFQRATWRKYVECYCIYRNCYHLLIELSGRKGSVTYGLGADISLPPSLPAWRQLSESWL